MLLSGMDGGAGGMGRDRRKECGGSNLFVSYQVTTVFVKGSPLEFVICGGHFFVGISLTSQKAIPMNHKFKKVKVPWNEHNFNQSQLSCHQDRIDGGYEFFPGLDPPHAGGKDEA